MIRMNNFEFQTVFTDVITKKCVKFYVFFVIFEFSNKVMVIKVLPIDSELQKTSKTFFKLCF